MFTDSWLVFTCKVTYTVVYSIVTVERDDELHDKYGWMVHTYIYTCTPYCTMHVYTHMQKIIGLGRIDCTLSQLLLAHTSTDLHGWMMHTYMY